MGMKILCSAAVGLLGAAGVLPAFAANQGASANELEVITVTAQKRSESEQTVPLSMTTFGAVAHDFDPRHLRRQCHRLLCR